MEKEGGGLGPWEKKKVVLQFSLFAREKGEIPTENIFFEEGNS